MEATINKQQPLTFHYDQLVLGGTLEALYFAHTLDLPIVYVEALKPYFFEVHGEVGNKAKLWDDLNLLLNLAGKNPLPNNCQSITYVDENTLKLINKNDKIFYVKFNRLWVFDDIRVNNLPVIGEDVECDQEIIDHFKILDGWNPETEHIYRDDQIIKEFHFFKEKPHKRLRFKHFYVVSKVPYGTASRIPDYFIRIRCEQILGSKRLEHLKRMTRIRLPKFTDTPTLKFCDITFEEMYPFSLKRRKITYQKYLKGKLKL